jgi:hypothetical protein
LIIILQEVVHVLIVKGKDPENLEKVFYI